MLTFEIFVPGRPRPKGSWKAITIAGHARLIPDNKRSKPWADTVAKYAGVSFRGEPWRGPVGIRIEFLFRRPNAHYRTRDRKPDRTRLRDGMPDYPTGARNYPDLDKLERNVWDALTGIVFADDVAIVDSAARKHWTNPDDEGALITVWKVEA